MKEHVLIGKIIKDMKIATDKGALLFITDQEEIIARADGDCCSKSWIEHIELPAYDFPLKVLSAEDIEMPDLGDMENCDVVSYYGFKITTEKGDIIIDYRNDSNGYYGGNLTWPDEDFYGGVYDQNNSSLEWTNIEE